MGRPCDWSCRAHPPLTPPRNVLSCAFFPPPKGPKQESPGQRPGDPICPFRALLFSTPDPIPRAAPWAGMSLPLRGEIQEAQLQNSQGGEKSAASRLFPPCERGRQGGSSSASALHQLRDPGD